MDGVEALVGMSDDESSSGAANGDAGDGGVLSTEGSEANMNGSDNELMNNSLEDGVGDEDDDEEDEDDSMNPVSAANALSELVGSVGGVLAGVGVAMDAGQNHHPIDNSSDQSASTRYLQVEGFDGRRNDIVYCKPLRNVPKNTENSLENANSDESSSGKESAAIAGTDAQTKSQTGTGVEEEKHKLLLFFGGDIQDFPEMMEQHRDHRNYVQFNLEATALVLQKQYPDHHIVVIRPSRIQMLTFSCYDNFVHCNHTGAPEHVITHHSLQHLELLLQNLSKRIANSAAKNTSAENDEGHSDELEGAACKIQQKEGAAGGKVNCNNGGEDPTVSSTTVDESAASGAKGDVSSAGAEGGTHNNGTTTNSTNGTSSKSISTTNKPNAKMVRLDRAQISIIGFSKGCVVLNQLLYEFHYLKTLTPDDLSMNDFLQCIKDMYWLDGGHNGGKNTWITSRSLLETLTRLGIRIQVHLTPYQLLDDRRPWIRKEEKMFSELLKKFNAPILRQIHFETENPSLQQHLRLIGDLTAHPCTQISSLLQENHRQLLVGGDDDDEDDDDDDDNGPMD